MSSLAPSSYRSPGQWGNGAMVNTGGQFTVNTGGSFSGDYIFTPSNFSLAGSTAKLMFAEVTASSAIGATSLNSSTSISAHEESVTGSLSPFIGTVAATDGTMVSTRGILVLQSPGAFLNGIDHRISATDVSLFHSGGGGVPIVSRVADIPAQAPYGMLQSDSGGIVLYRAGSGAIEPSHAADSLQMVSHSGGMAMSAIGTVPNGAHSRPLQYRAAPGEKIAWTAGDLGRDDHASRDGSLALGEVGAGYSFGPVQVNVALGRTRTRQNTSLGGLTSTYGNYFLTEALAPLSAVDGGAPLWLTLSGYGHWGDASIRRGYLNLGVQDNSTGTPDTRAYGVRARLDWENAFAAGKFAFSPYADLTHSILRMDAYTETGGGFPARFDASHETVDELRLGLHAARPLAAGVRFLTLGELAHRFQGKSAATSGEVLGMFAFNLPGQTVKKDWLRLGAGIEGRLGEGTGSLMLNLTSRGSAPNAWLALSYQIGF